MIESSANQQIKNVVKLMKTSRERRKQGVFVVEGPKMVLEALDMGLVDKVYISEELRKLIDSGFVTDNNRFAGVDSSKVRTMLENVSYEVVKDSVFKELSDTVTPQGMLALVRMNVHTMEGVFDADCGILEYEGKDIRRYIILDDLQDPGNLGTIFRTAEAAGYNGIFMNKGTVDAYNPKVVRSTMGAILRVPFAYVEDINEIFEKCKHRNIHIYGAALEGEDIRNVQFCDCSAFVIGNESKGMSDISKYACDSLIRIPMCGSIESLNASVAAGITMYLSSLQFM